jgi:glycosyltransferase (activator-dependent family)
MRVLFAAVPEPATFLYQVPLAWALRTAGHEVQVASQPGFTDTITQAGLTAVPVGRYRDTPRMRKLAAAELEAERPGIPAPYDAFQHPDPGAWDDLVQGYQDALHVTHKPANFPMIAELVEYARWWQPDLVIWDPLTYAGAIAAKACGAAHARLLFGVDVFGLTRDHYLRLKTRQPPTQQADPLADWLAGYGRRYGFAFSEDMITGQFTIDQFPDSLSMRANLHHLRMQYVPYGGPAVVPKWLWPPPERPRVALTMGLSATEVYSGYTISMPEVLAGLADLDIEVIATVAAAEQRELRTLPGNVRTVSYVPWHALVPSCSVVIHHAGAATLATTSLHPVPQLALHYHFDQPILARMLAEQGAGLEIHTSQATGPQVCDAVQRLLTEPRFRERAAALCDEIRSLPTPNQLVPQLEELTTKHRTR